MCVLSWPDAAGPALLPAGGGLASGTIGHLVCWERHERDGSWWAWVSWVRETGDPPVHKLVCVPARYLTQLETPAAYRHVPRRILGRDGRTRPWSPG
jgi:hypothetical protein